MQSTTSDRKAEANRRNAAKSTGPRTPEGKSRSSQNATISTGLSVRFNLTSRLAGPVFTSASFVNGASFQPGISPGSIAVITVAGIAPAVRGVVNGANVVGPLPTTLNGVSITFNSIAAPIYYVSNVNNVETVAVQVPFEVLPGSATVTVSIPGGGSTTAQNVEILPVKPGVFTTVDPVTNQVIAVATRPDGSFVSSANPARRGEALRIFATGLGQTTPATGTNRTGAVGQSVAVNLVVGVNNAGTRLISAELAVGLIGVYEVTIEVPSDISGGPSAPIGLGVINAAGTAAEFSQATFLPIL